MNLYAKSAKCHWPGCINTLLFTYQIRDAYNIVYVYTSLIKLMFNKHPKWSTQEHLLCLTTCCSPKYVDPDFIIRSSHNVSRMISSLWSRSRHNGVLNYVSSIKSPLELQSQQMIICLYLAPFDTTRGCWTMYMQPHEACFYGLKVTCLTIYNVSHIISVIPHCKEWHVVSRRGP